MIVICLHCWSAAGFARMCPRFFAGGGKHDAHAVGEHRWLVHVMNRLVHQWAVAAPLDVRLGALERIADRDLSDPIAEHSPPAAFQELSLEALCGGTRHEVDEAIAETSALTELRVEPPTRTAS